MTPAMALGRSHVDGRRPNGRGNYGRSDKANAAATSAWEKEVAACNAANPTISRPQRPARLKYPWPLWRHARLLKPMVGIRPRAGP
jgi:hypothetical protein